MLRHLYNPKTKRGLLVKHGDAVDRQLVGDALEAAHQFFAFIEERLLARQPVVRVREEGFAEPWLEDPLLALHKAVRVRADRMDDGRERDELLEQAQRLKTCQTALRQFLSLADRERQVYWVERSGRRQTIVTLRTAPIDVAPFIRESLLSRSTSAVFASATLAMGGTIEPFQKRIGAEGVASGVEHSPFDYARNMRVYVATDIPVPTAQDARLALDVLTDYIDFCTRRHPGGSLVLFTSYADLRAVAAALEPVYGGAGRPFFMQGRDHSRTELARLLRESGNGVLFGTDSFWTGIDVPGHALSQVIVTRLPFEVPTHPVLEARTEWIRERGGSPFHELTLPDALIKFRQGIGRLIRSTKDRGLITILDSRIVGKPYGRQFLACLPQPNVRRITRLDRAERFQPFV
jgi:ATP-dependent DNA helicase DinG